MIENYIIEKYVVYLILTVKETNDLIKIIRITNVPWVLFIKIFLFEKILN